MNFIKRNVVILHSGLIIKDLHGDVIDNLRDKGVLTSTEYESINSQIEQEDRNRKFLEILYTKPGGFHPFLDSLKDWYWWIEKRLKDTLTGRPSTLDEAIALSKVPAIPRINVSRVDLLNEVREALRNVKKGEYVVLHGMSGSGKSSLAAEALHHQILLDRFQGRVVWLSCGHDIKDDENEVLALQIELNATICDEELVNDVKTATINTLRVNLQRRFQTSDFKDGLVVLDDVNSPHVIEALQIGCKTLVTTIDKDVMKKQGGRCREIQVSESFKEEETMQYLAKCVEVPVNELPSQAALIHKHGKGHPLIMSLIGAHLRDHLDESQRHEENWQAWLDVLVKREYGELKRRSFTNELNEMTPQTIKICISNLDPRIREKYQDFALFVEDVNIKTEVLEILWNLPMVEVKKIMHELYTKSLVVRKYNEAQSSYVYGIHDILRYYLRQQLDEQALMNLHLKVIKRYKEVCNGDLSQLPRNDNYFFYYIGYHIANSKQYVMFQEWYFNLDFIEAKLKVAGPGDLLLDYKRYSAHFIDGFYDRSAISKRLSDFVRFVEVAGLDVKRNNGPDIVQLALQEPHDSDVYKAALPLAQSRSQTTYLRFKLGPSKSKAAPHTIQTREKVSAACFSNDDDHLIVAFESGTIQILHQRGHKVREYEGHSGKVTRLDVSLQKKIFLSVSNSCVKIWQLPDLDYNVKGDCGDRSPSPSQRQDNFADLFNCRSPDKRKSWFTIPCKGEVKWANFSHDGSRFAICCKDENKVEIYGPANPEDVASVKEPWTVYVRIMFPEPSSLVFSADNKFVAIGSLASFMIVYEMENMRKGCVFKKVVSYPILSLFALPEIKFGVLTRANLSVWNLEHVDEADGTNTTPVPCLKDYTKGDCELYTCCAAADDGSLVAVATSNSKILICDPSDGSVIREIHESTGNINYLAMDGTKDNRLLACYDDSTVRVWRLGEVYTHRPVMMRCNFVVAWTPDNKPILVAPTFKSCVKKITDLTDLNKSEDLAVPVNGDINICGISDCGKYIVVGTPAGEVFLHREGNTQPMLEVLVVKGHDCITKLSVKKIRKRIFVVVGLKRSIKLWTCKEELDPDNEVETNLVYKKKKTYEFLLHDRLVESFILSSEELISVSMAGTIMKCCMKRGKKEVLWHGRLENVEICAADLSCGNILATLDARRRMVFFYDVGFAEIEEQNFKLEEGIPTCCSFSLDGKKLAVGFANGFIQLWDMVSLEPRPVSTGGEAIECVCVSNTGLIGAATPSRVVQVTTTGSVGQARLKVSKVVMFPDDVTIMTVDVDGHVHLIDQFTSSNCNSVVRLSRTFSNV